MKIQKEFDEELLVEMAKIPKSDTHLPYDIWLDSVGKDRKNKHTLARIKIFVNGEDISITIDKTNPSIPSSISSDKKIRKLASIKAWIIKHYDTLMKHWNKEISDREALNIIYKADNQ